MENQNPVGTLNEYCQQNKIQFPVYTLTGQEGQQHMQIFKMQCVLEGRVFSGEGFSKKDAKKKSAESAVTALINDKSNFNNKYDFFNN